MRAWMFVAGTSAGTAAAVKELPDDLAVMGPAELSKQCALRDDTLATLFPRWPALDGRELRQLRATYAERLRIARHVGILRAREASKEQARSKAGGGRAVVAPVGTQTDRFVAPGRFRYAGHGVLTPSESNEKGGAMPVWAWVLIIVLLVLLLTGGVYVRR
jgi:hypothetical protein